MNRGQVADIIGRSALSPYQKLVLLCYMSHLPSAAAIGSGVAWPGLQTLASWASCSRSTAQAARAQLLEAGILVAVERSEVAMKCRLNLVALAAWAPEEGGAARRQGAATRHGGVPPAGTGGAATRHGGVPPAGTEPSSDNPPKQPSKENLDGAGAPALSLRKEEETRTTSGTSTSQPGEAERLFERLERLRAERQAQLGRPARPSRPEIWVPKLRKALKTFGGAGAVEDAWVWLLKAPGAAWHRGEDGKGPDRTVDFATLLAHPEYAEKRDWKGPLGPTKQEIQEELAWLDGDGRPEDEPAWRQRRAAVGADHGLRDRGQREAGAEGPAAAAADAWVCPF